MRRKAFIGAVLIAMLLAAVLAPLADLQTPHATPGALNKLLFLPAAYPAGNWRPENLQFRDIDFTSTDGTPLHAWFCPSGMVVDQSGQNPFPRAVLFLHGNASNITRRAELYRHFQSELRVDLLAPDYRGYGKSEGVPTAEGVMADARAALTELCKLTDTQPSSVVVIGESLGGAVAAELAAEFARDDPTRKAAGIKALVLVNTFSSLQELAQLHYPRQAGMVPKQLFNTASQLVQFKGPVLICQAAEDRVVPLQQAESLFAQANEPKAFFLIPAADHDAPWTAECLAQLGAFFDQLDN